MKEGSREQVGRAERSAPVLSQTAASQKRVHARAQEPTFALPRFGCDVTQIPSGRPSLPIQAKVRVGAPDDAYEKEAETVAERLLREPPPAPGPEQRPEILRRSAGSGNTLSLPVTPALEAQIRSLSSGGQPLPAEDRSFFERRFGTDFSQVRIHHEPAAGDSARALNAEAYTLGNDIAFHDGAPAPGTAAGRALLAHELVHVVQQQGRVESPPAREVVQTRPVAASQTSQPQANIGMPELLSLDLGNPLILAEIMRAIDRAQPPSATQPMATLSLGGFTMSIDPQALAKLRTTARAEIAKGVRRAKQTFEEATTAYDAQKEIDREHYIVAPIVQFVGRVQDPGVAIQTLGMAVQADAVLAQQPAAQLAPAAEALIRCETNARKARQLAHAYREQIISAGEASVRTLEFTRDASFVTLGVLATIATAGGAAGAIGAGTATSATAIATGAPIVGSVAQAGVSLALGDKVDWGRLALDTLSGLILARFGGPLSNRLFKLLAGNPAVLGVVRLFFGRVVTSVAFHELSQAFTTVVNSAYDALRGRDISWELFLDELVTRMADPKGVFIAAVMGAVEAGAQKKYGPPRPTPEKSPPVEQGPKPPREEPQPPIEEPKQTPEQQPKASEKPKQPGEESPDFAGKLRGEKVTLGGIKTQKIQYTKRNPSETASLRREFDTSARKRFLQALGGDPAKLERLKQAGLSDGEIQTIKEGRVPKRFQVHHKRPLDDGGTNDFENLVLIENEPYHKVITNEQNALTSTLKPGETVTLDFPIPDGFIYPP